MQNPPEDMIKQAVEFSKEMTFTKELDGFMKKIQTAINDSRLMRGGPVLKLFAPFVRTPTNLVTEALKHTPAMFINPSFLKGIKTGGREADLAMAKVGLGMSVMGVTGTLAFNGKITGAGPGNKKLKKTYEATGWRPYSLVFNAENWSEEGINELKSYGLVSQGQGKIYWSYDGLQPLSTILGTGSTIGEYFMANSYANSQGYGPQDMHEQILMLGVMSGYDILSEAPMLQGVSELVDAIGGGANEAETLRSIKNIN